uniref:phosphorylase b kinase regulatory subunit alpha, liver isoform-like isoform X2 n=1 Tax=Ciona intestinalis TaxID=7719 RepID=UPI00052133F3|nr:phosphorylase b kinase regulatory subunit alpha, liver isoform-like isoform X2 [Ciona intestinalis]|eukprot:XP_026696670.1 phosphorylase b kinase regulatory subunit alpha, liver isoform-like isoform X2 [Ciona intestinalis]
MRSRSNSGVKLDNYARIIQKSILKFQDPITGLFSASKHAPHAWVRDNLYSLQAVWGLALAYRKHADLDEDKAKSYELEQSVVKCMRSLLQCMMRQVEKLEAFKTSLSPNDSLHAKYNRKTCGLVVGDQEWGHLQLDATGLYVLMLAQMTASGFEIIYTLDEVDFVQNLVFYISCAFRTPDYGIWERGDKTNHGVPELNASSVGMCKAALEAIDEINLFGASGGHQSVIHVTPDEKALCQAILQSLLPRESNSKEVDAGLLSVIGYPAFAVNDEALVKLTRQEIVDKLQGRYGCGRFLRDGYKTALEDSSRLHYELAELKVFENIECEWPLFWSYLLLDGIFNDNQQQVIEYRDAMREVLVLVDGVRCVPELYAVPADKVELEKANPKSQDRIPLGKLPHLWGHSLYLLGQLLWDGFLAPGEIDPLNRRFATAPKPDVVVQVAIYAEEKSFQTILKKKLGIHVDSLDEVAPIMVQPARVLTSVYSMLGKNKKMKLSGRPSNQIGVLGTSKLYVMNGRTFAFTPNLLDQRDFYMSLDTDMLIDMMLTELQYLSTYWNMPGRPIITVPIHSGMLAEDGENFKPSLISTLRKIQSGYLYGVRVVLGSLKSFMSTSCKTRLTFLETEDAEASDLMELLLTRAPPRLYRLGSHTDVKSSLRSSNRSQSMQLTPEEHQQRIWEAKLVGKQRQRRISTDLTSSFVGLGIATFNENLLKKIKLLGENEEPTSPQLKPKVLVHRLHETMFLWEQADILHYLYTHKGPNWDTEIDGEPGVLVVDLIEELYDKAGQQGNWMVVRQMSGLLQKRVSGLSQSVTDLLIRQKQVTVGLPQEPKEFTITRPMPADELHGVITDSFGDDTDMAVLTQEIIMYLAMFIRASPALFTDLLRLRVGLIIQVMASELARHLSCSGEEASTHLMSLSPFEMKQLILNVLSGKEFGVIKSVRTSSASATTLNHEISFQYNRSSKADKSNFISIKKHLRRKDLSGLISPPVWTQHSFDGQYDPASSPSSIRSMSALTAPAAYAQFAGHKRGQWVRRRRIDGALNRVPHNFYTRIWKLLEKCYGLVIGEHHIPGYVTKEMTQGEIKFALLVENVLNHIPQPEYRQLVVETLVVLTLLAETPRVKFLSDNINVDRVLVTASDMFCQDESDDGAPEDILQKDPTTSVCTEFYDCAPSGPHGTMTYMSKAVATSFSEYFPEYVGDCSVS